MNHCLIQQIIAKLLKSLILDEFPAYHLSLITYHYLLIYVNLWFKL